MSSQRHKQCKTLRSNCTSHWVNVLDHAAQRRFQKLRMIWMAFSGNSNCLGNTSVRNYPSTPQWITIKYVFGAHKDKHTTQRKPERKSLGLILNPLFFTDNLTVQIVFHLVQVFLSTWNMCSLSVAPQEKSDELQRILPQDGRWLIEPLAKYLVLR